MGEFERAKWPRQTVGAAVTSVFVAGLCFLRSNPYLSQYPSFGLIGLFSYAFFSLVLPFFFLSLATVAGIWFGGWGILAIFIGTIFFPPYRGEFHTLIPFVELYDIAGVVFQASILAWAFRHFKVDPRLDTERDVGLFWVFVFLASFVSTLIMFVGPYVSYTSNLYVRITFCMQAWFLGTSIFTLFFSFPLLQQVSRRVIEARAYCKGWFS